MFLNCFFSFVRIAWSVGLRAAHALAAILLVLIASTWIVSFGGYADCYLGVPTGMMKQWTFLARDGDIVVFRGRVFESGTFLPQPIEHTWHGLKWYRGPGTNWQFSVPITWSAPVLGFVVAAPIMMRLRRRRRLMPWSNPITVESKLTTDRGVRSSVASLARRWLAIASIAASIVVVSYLFQRCYASATYRTNAGRQFSAHLDYYSLIFHWPSQGWEHYATTIPQYKPLGFEYINHGQNKSLRIHPAILLPLVALGAVPQIMQGFRRRRVAHRARNGLCLACGYDLTGNVTGACPECGLCPASGGFVNPPN